MKIASRATPEGLAGHGLSTTTIQHKQSVVNTPLERSKKNLLHSPRDLNSTMKYVKRTLMLNGYPFC